MRPLLILFLLILTSCSSTRQEEVKSTEQKVEQKDIKGFENFRLIGEVAGVSVNLNLLGERTENTKKQINSTNDSKTTSESKSTVNIPPQVGSSLLSLLIPGGGGILATIGVLLKKYLDVKGTLGTVVNAVQEFKQANPTQKQNIHTYLDKHLDSKHKNIVKKMKTK